MQLETETFENLVDLLAEHTEIYSRYLVDGNRGEELQASKRIIKLLQAEISNRQHGPRPGNLVIPANIGTNSSSDGNIQSLAGL
ncbi:MAG: hypothetical protein H7Y42_10100 [Chitinophagaceae bacterium]|nr:hypothetical protein [Chitinophagaceae bacterium]